MKNGLAQKLLAVALLATAVLFIVVGCFHSYKVFPKKNDPFAEFNVVAFSRISDREMVIYATVGGVERRDGQLYSLYDRSELQQKKKCPT